MDTHSLHGNFRLSAVLALAGLLAACGGSSGSDDAFDGEDITGIWVGTVDVDEGAQDVGALMIVRANGKIYADSGLVMLIGEAATDSTAFSGTADGYSWVGHPPNGTDFSMTGTVTAGTVITGAFSEPAASGTFSFTYNPALSELPASLASIGGTYASELWIGKAASSISVTIDANGGFTGSGGGCTLDGDVEVLDSARNIYRWEANLAGCAVNGSGSGIGISEAAGGFYFLGTVEGHAIYFASFDVVEHVATAPGKNAAVGTLRSRLLQQAGR